MRQMDEQMAGSINVPLQVWVEHNNLYNNFNMKYVREIKIFHLVKQTEMRMIRWMCHVKVKNRVPSKELRQREIRNR